MISFENMNLEGPTIFLLDQSILSGSSSNGYISYILATSTSNLLATSSSDSLCYAT